MKHILLPFLMIGPVPAPTNLQFTEVTPESFRGTWDHGASDVSLYRITWAPVGNPDKLEVMLALSLSLLSHSLSICLKESPAEIQLISVYQ